MQLLSSSSTAVNTAHPVDGGVLCSACGLGVETLDLRCVPGASTAIPRDQQVVWAGDGIM